MIIGNCDGCGTLVQFKRGKRRLPIRLLCQDCAKDPERAYLLSTEDRRLLAMRKDA